MEAKIASAAVKLDGLIAAVRLGCGGVHMSGILDAGAPPSCNHLRTQWFATPCTALLPLTHIQLRELSQSGKLADVDVTSYFPTCGSAVGAFAAALTRLDNDLTKIVIELDCLEVEGPTRALRLVLLYGWTWSGFARFVVIWGAGWVTPL